jgi:hypothetical protein
VVRAAAEQVAESVWIPAVAGMTMNGFMDLYEDVRIGMAA